jgi:hexosaminidase
MNPAGGREWSNRHCSPFIPSENERRHGDIAITLFFFAGDNRVITVTADLSCSRRMPTGLRFPAVAITAALLLSGCQESPQAPTATAAAAPPAPAPRILSLIPEPLTLIRHDGQFTVTASTRLICPEGDKDCAWLAGYLADLVKRTRGIALMAASGDVSGPPHGTILLRRVARATSENPESYNLQAGPDGVVISAGTDAGLFYGAVTLWQLLSQDEGHAATIDIPALDIEDAPRLAWRGILLDSARHFQSPAFVKSFIDAMALHKLNVLHWHLTDDQGWRLEIRRYPRLTSVGAWRPIPGKRGRYGGFYTQSQVRDIVAYAKRRNVTIVPEIEMPGHSLAAIIAYPRLGSVAHPSKNISNDWGTFPYLFNVDASTFEFLDNVLREVMALFPGPYIHIGGDEAAPDQWEASPRVRAQMRALHIADAAGLRAYFAARISRFLDAHGRRTVGWDEILSGKLPPDAVITSWHDAQGAAEAADQGHDVVLAPSVPLYLNYCETDAAGQPPCRADIQSLKSVYDFDPLPPQIGGEERRRIIGIEACVWSEYIAADDLIDEAAFPRAAALAEVGWSEKRDWRDFLERMPAQMDRYKALGIAHSQSEFAVRIDALPDAGSARVSLGTEAGLGQIRYALDGAAPDPASPLYAAPFTTALPATVTAAAFWHGRALTPPSRDRIDARSLLRRSSYALKQCTHDLVLSLAGGPHPDVRHAAFMVNVMNPCWIYQQADLSQIGGIEVSADRLPFNFQLGHDIAKIPRHPTHSRYGELEVRLDSCKGELAAVMPLGRATRGNTRTTLRATIAPRRGVHDLCFLFTRRGVDPVWVIDQVQLLPAQAAREE